MFNTIIPLFIVIFLGFLLKKIKLAKDSWIEVLNNYALYIGLPMMIFNSFIGIDKVNTSIFFVNLVWIAVSSLGIFWLLKLFNLPKKIRNTYLICISFGNIGYLGIPFISSIMPGSTASISLVIASTMFVQFTLVLYLINKKSNLMSIFKNPLIISPVLGLVVWQFNILVPEFLKKSILMISQSASPVALFAIGIFLARPINLNKDLVHAGIISFMKLVVFPSVFFLILLILNLNFKIALLEAGMPVAVAVFAFTEKYKLDKNIIIYSIILSTALALITLPILSMII